MNSPRLDQLLELRKRINVEIDRERRAFEAAERVRRDTLAAITQGNWNQRVLTACCEWFGVQSDDLLSGGRRRITTDARHAFMWLMRSSGLSYPDVGRELGMDHTTVINGVRRVESTPRLRAAAGEIYLMLTGEEIEREEAS